MSVHAMIAAAYVEGLDPSSRLVLMAVADSSDEHTRESAPGLPKLRAWSGLGKQQTIRRVRDLEAAGLLEQVGKAYRGRRAVWRVFPNGIPAIPHPDEIAARYATESTGGKTDDEPVENPEIMGNADGTQSELMGVIRGPNGERPRYPFSLTLQSSTRERPPNPPARPVDNATPSRATGAGFPGARREPTAATDPRLAPNPGPLCPDHPTEHVPCRRCVHDAANSDLAKIDTARKTARKAAAAARRTATAHSPEETTA